jgi:hypothetical protein
LCEELTTTHRKNNIKNNETNTARGMCGVEQSCIHGFYGEPTKKDHSEYLGADWIIILKWAFRKSVRRARIDMSQDRDMLWAVVNTVMNLRVPQMTAYLD